jgi:hypothetical protein
VRLQRGFYSEYTEDLAKRTVKYQIKHDPRNTWILFSRGIPSEENKVNLVEELQMQLLSPWERRFAYCERWLRSIFLRRLGK